MSAESEIRRQLQACLTAKGQEDGVRFVDHLLGFGHEVGHIKCSLTEDHQLRFQVGDQSVWEIEVQRAKSILRLVCARLAVLCNETGAQDISIYGGDGVIELLAPSDHGDLPAASKATVATLERPLARAVKKVAVRFTNTMHTQEFTIANISE